VLKPMIGGVANFALIEENWDEYLRLTASDPDPDRRTIAVAAPTGGLSRQNAQAKTLREIGCIERTVFTLDWIVDPPLRRRSNAGLN
jgi:TnpA family transposase